MTTPAGENRMPPEWTVEPELRGPTPRRLRPLPVESDIIVALVALLAFPGLAALGWDPKDRGMAYTFGGIGLFCYWIFGSAAYKRFVLLRRGVPVCATIHSKEYRSMRNSHAYRITYSFHAGGRERRGIVLMEWFICQDVKEGRPMTALYDPRRPGRHMLYQRARFQPLFAPAPEGKK